MSKLYPTPVIPKLLIRIVNGEEENFNKGGGRMWEDHKRHLKNRSIGPIDCVLFVSKGRKSYRLVWAPYERDHPQIAVLRKVIDQWLDFRVRSGGTWNPAEMEANLAERGIEVANMGYMKRIWAHIYNK